MNTCPLILTDKLNQYFILKNVSIYPDNIFCKVCLTLHIKHVLKKFAINLKNCAFKWNHWVNRLSSKQGEHELCLNEKKYEESELKTVIFCLIHFNCNVEYINRICIDNKSQGLMIVWSYRKR